MDNLQALAPASTEQNPTPEQLASWEKQYPGLKKVEVEDGKVVCFRRPTRQIVEVANTILSKTHSPQKYADVLLANCQLNWQKATAEDDELYFALVPLVDGFISAKAAQLVN